jgi:hypothetical protein
MVQEYDRFVCQSCNKTSVVRPKSDKEEDAPECISCSESTGGKSQMTWIGDFEKHQREKKHTKEKQNSQ